MKTSQKGVAHAKPFTLKPKQCVYSLAMLMKIPPDCPDTSDPSLKIGRYPSPFGKLANDKPKGKKAGKPPLRGFPAFLSKGAR